MIRSLAVAGGVPVGWLRRWLRRGGGKAAPAGAELVARPGARASLRQLEKRIGYRFRNRELAESALKHRSIIFETGETREETNERLEFLGDAVLDLLAAEQLYEEHPHAREGDLTRMKSLAVSGRQLAGRARKLGLGQFLQISEGEDRSGGRNRGSILEDALEALIGAIYLDGGLPAARRFVQRHVVDPIPEGGDLVDRERNFKSVLLEDAQSRGLGHPLYKVLSEEGPDHDKTFTVEVQVGGESAGVGLGRSKKQAEQAAAEEAAHRFGLLNGEEHASEAPAPEAPDTD
jgi:ribonuclease-3